MWEEQREMEEATGSSEVMGSDPVQPWKPQEWLSGWQGWRAWAELRHVQFRIRQDHSGGSAGRNLKARLMGQVAGRALQLSGQDHGGCRRGAGSQQALLCPDMGGEDRAYTLQGWQNRAPAGDGRETEQQEDGDTGGCRVRKPVCLIPSEDAAGV